MSTTRLRRNLVPAGYHLFLLVMSVIAVFPLYWIISSSFKTGSEIAASPTALIPSEPTLRNYQYVIGEMRLLDNVGNSLLIAISTTALTILISATGAYGVVRFFPTVGRRMTRLLIVTYMFPPILLAVPYATIMAALGLVNTYFGLVLVYLSFSVPYAMWMLVGFYATVPEEIEQAAAVDGAGQFRIFATIATPIVMPGIVATAIYTFINAFNEFLYALLFINTSARMPVSVRLYSLMGSEVLDWGALMASSVLVVVPSVIFFMLIQRHIAGGLAEGSVK